MAVMAGAWRLRAFRRGSLSLHRSRWRHPAAELLGYGRPSRWRYRIPTAFSNNKREPTCVRPSMHTGQVVYLTLLFARAIIHRLELKRSLCRRPQRDGRGHCSRVEYNPLSACLYARPPHVVVQLKSSGRSQPCRRFIVRDWSFRTALSGAS